MVGTLGHLHGEGRERTLKLCALQPINHIREGLVNSATFQGLKDPGMRGPIASPRDAPLWPWWTARSLPSNTAVPQSVLVLEQTSSAPGTR